MIGFSRKTICLIFSIFCIGEIISQAPDFNLELVANVDFTVPGNDVWGYVDENGTEYAIIGSFNDSRIYSLQDPSNPDLIFSIPGGGSSWRDFKTFKNYLYIVADGSDDGLIIADLSQISDGIVQHKTLREFAYEGDTINITRCHNLNIDENNSILSISGSRTANGGGNILFDLTKTPNTPIVIGLGPPIYSHDNIIRDGIIYSSDLGAGLNIIHASTSEILGNFNTGRNTTHNAWINDEATVVFTTDEVSGAYVEAYDISDLDNIEMISRYRPADIPGAPASPHNVHFFNGYLVTSFYSDGVKIIDASVPDNLVEVASFDTYLPPSFSGSDGLWGAYPYLPSGLVLGSDLDAGLFVWRPTYERAFRVTGTVTNSQTQELIFDAHIEISRGDYSLSTMTDVQGMFKTGFAQSQADPNGSGAFTMNLTKEGFEPASIFFDITEEGNIDFPDLQLTPIVSGVGDPLVEGLVSVLQNPTSDIFNVELDIPLRDVTARVYNTNGQLIEKLIVENSNLEFGSAYIPGMYLLEIQSPEGYASVRLIKN